MRIILFFRKMRRHVLIILQLMNIVCEVVPQSRGEALRTQAIQIEAVPKQVSCEKLKSDSFQDYQAKVKKCWMTQTTAIESLFYTIVNSDEMVTSLDFTNNKKILYLPINVYKNFPELDTYEAGYCLIKEIKKTNFANLKNLHWLFLNQNQIEIVPVDAFEDLSSLARLFLSMEILEM